MMDANNRREIRIVSDEVELVRLGADVFIRCAREASSKRGIFSVMLSGGNTPKKLYQYLSSTELRDQVPWKNTHVFWGDERTVPPDHPDSNFRMAWENLLRFVPIPLKQIHRVRTELDPVEHVAEDYEKQMRDFTNQVEGATENPHFDLILLGMGEDGHTASLFPGIRISENEKKWVFSLSVPHLHTYRISVSPRVIHSGRKVVSLISGEKKAHSLKEVLEGPFDPNRYPAQRVNLREGSTLWIVDRPAASLLKGITWSASA